MKRQKNTASLGISGSVWLHREDQRFLGGDRISLLEKIDEYGSITKAAKSVGISYKTAWDVVNMINNLAEKPLVNRSVGGKGGGGYLPYSGRQKDSGTVQCYSGRTPKVSGKHRRQAWRHHRSVPIFEEDFHESQRT